MMLGGDDHIAGTHLLCLAGPPFRIKIFRIELPIEIIVGLLPVGRCGIARPYSYPFGSSRRLYAIPFPLQ